MKSSVSIGMSLVIEVWTHLDEVDDERSGLSVLRHSRIQKFIFAVPNLRCIIGSSSQIAEFDESVRDQMSAEVVYVGGGTGVLRIRGSDEERVRDFFARARP